MKEPNANSSTDTDSSGPTSEDCAGIGVDMDGFSLTSAEASSMTSLFSALTRRAKCYREFVCDTSDDLTEFEASLLARADALDTSVQAVKDALALSPFA